MFKQLYIKKAILTVCISIALISVGATITAVHALDKFNMLEKEVFNSSVRTDNEPDYYYVKEHNDMIGIFDEQDSLLYTVEVYTKTLPAKDRALLKEGIVAQTREELYEILGDYDA